MLTPGQVPLVAQRWQPYFEPIDFPGYDFTGGAFAAEVRAYRDAPTALITLNVALLLTYANGLPTSTLTLSAPESTINAVAFTNPRGGDLTVVWDLHITSSIGKRRWLEGPFTIRAGSTQNG